MRQAPDDPDFKIENYPFYHLARAAGRYNAALDAALAPLGLDQALWRLLMVVHEYPGASLSDLLGHAVLPQSTITRRLQRLERAGLLKRRARADDARVLHLELTAAGAAVRARSLALVSGIFRQALAGIGESSLDRWVRVLIAIEANLNQSAAPD